MMDKEVLLRADSYGRSPCDGTIPIPDDIDDIV
jgi:hypothetical protein